MRGQNLLGVAAICGLALSALAACGSRNASPPVDRQTVSLPIEQSTTQTHRAYRQDDGGVDARGVLRVHNEARERHGVRPLSWSPALAASAKAWAQNCEFKHSGAAGKGENLSRWQGPFTQREMVDIWYDEITDYDFRTGDAKRPGAMIGHFTQMVWAGTTQVGCGYASCPRVGEYLVCQYAPAGNVRTQFVQNVPPPRR